MSAAAAQHTTGDALACASLTLARRFADGATLWCFAPQWPSHGRHVAVEFVHPVIMGKRAFPAVHADRSETLRLVARPGDVLLVLGTAAHPVVADVLRRAQAWGLTRLWLGPGKPPPPGAAEHVVALVDADPSQAPHAGELVLHYHLLWELTHVVFEHPGLLVDEQACTEEVCITCSDEGRVAEIRAVGEGGVAEVVVDGHREVIDASLVDPVEGDLVLVHAGVAVSTLDGSGAR